jgi:hypothetical protein
MTEDEDRANGEKNEQIRACRHDPKWTDVRGCWCRLCGARFATVLRPRQAVPLPLEPEEDAR